MQIHATARCEAAGPWGMQGTIEDLMAKEALQTLQKFLEFARQRCEERFGPNVRRAVSLPPHQCTATLPDECLLALLLAGGTASGGRRGLPRRRYRTS